MYYNTKANHIEHS